MDFFNSPRLAFPFQPCPFPYPSQPRNRLMSAKRQSELAAVSSLPRLIALPTNSRSANSFAWIQYSDRQGQVICQRPACSSPSFPACLALPCHELRNRLTVTPWLGLADLLPLSSSNLRSMGISTQTKLQRPDNRQGAECLVCAVILTWHVRRQARRLLPL